MLPAYYSFCMNIKKSDVSHLVGNVLSFIRFRLKRWNGRNISFRITSYSIFKEFVSSVLSSSVRSSHRFLHGSHEAFSFCINLRLHECDFPVFKTNMRSEWRTLLVLNESEMPDSANILFSCGITFLIGGCQTPNKMCTSAITSMWPQINPVFWWKWGRFEVFSRRAVCCNLAGMTVLNRAFIVGRIETFALEELLISQSLAK